MGETSEVSDTAMAPFSNSMVEMELSSTAWPVLLLNMDWMRTGLPSIQAERYIGCAPRSIIAPPPVVSGSYQ